MPKRVRPGDFTTRILAAIAKLHFHAIFGACETTRMERQWEPDHGGW
jgi:hypothetical protein